MYPLERRQSEDGARDLYRYDRAYILASSSLIGKFMGKVVTKGSFVKWMKSR